jgi:hypothetical protein
MTLQPADLLQLLARGTTAVPGVDLCLHDPLAQRFRPDPQLRPQRLAAAHAEGVLIESIHRHPGRALRCSVGYLFAMIRILRKTASRNAG